MDYVNSNWTKNDEFSPPWYLRSGHLQTLLTGFYKPKVSILPDVTHKIPMGELGEMLVHENLPAHCLDDTRAVFLLHGLGSCHRGTYMSRITANLLANNVRVFRFDLPGAGDSYLNTPLPPHGACSELVWDALKFLTNRCGITTWRGAGVSLGGNILLKLAATHASELAEVHNSSVRIERAVAVAPPIDLNACCRNMENGFNTIYAKYFLKSLKRQTLSRAELWPQWKEILPGASFRSIREFDNTVTSALAGFSNAEAYYHAGSSKDVLDQIAIDTLILVDEHDPIVPIDIFLDARFSKGTKIVSTRRGGHVGYLSKTASHDEPPKMAGHPKRKHHRWADDWISQKLTEQLA